MAEKKTSETVVPVTDGPLHGYIGTAVDDTPNEAYSVAGQAPAGESSTVDADEAEKKPARRSAKPTS